MFVKEDLSKFIEDLKTLVDIDSPTNNKEGVAKVASFFKERAKNLGLKVVEKEQNTEAGPAVIVTNAEETEDLDILMLAHLDTVYPVGTAQERGFTTNENKAFGPGVIDDKGGALLGLYALEKLENLGTVKIALLLNSNEEEGSKGNNITIQEYAKRSSYVLVLEAAREDGSLVDKRYGTVTYKVKFQGKESSTPNFSEGASALLEAANFMRYVAVVNNAFKGNLINFTIQEPQEVRYSQVQSEVTLGLQMRFLSHEGLKVLADKIQYAKDHKSNKTVEIIEELLSYYPPMVMTLGAKDFKKDIWLCGRYSGVHVTWSASFGGSDGSFASETGALVIDGLGPKGGKFHTVDEYIDLSSVEPRCNFLIRIIQAIINKKDKKSV